MPVPPIDKMTLVCHKKGMKTLVPKLGRHDQNRITLPV